MKPRRRGKSSKRPAPKRRERPSLRRAPKRAQAPRKTKRTKRAKSTASADRKAIAALEREIRRLRLARGRLERSLTAAVQEIGMLRQFEIRAQALEAELSRRDGLIAELRRERDERVREIDGLGGTSIASTPS
jgi:predicted  nucleic acid-binding Zn-ribbon protein